MTPFVLSVDGELTSPKFAAAFAKGCGGEILHARPGLRGADLAGRPWAGFGSPQIWDSLSDTIKAGGTWYYGDNAYFGRKKYYRVTKNRWQHDGQNERPDFNRLKMHISRTRPFSRNGRNIIVCPQSDGYHQRMGDPKWLEHTIAKIKLYSDRPIVVRTKKTDRPLAADLPDAWCLVTHASNSAVEALIEGVPVFCTGDCPATHMGLSDPANVEYPYYPDGVMEWAGVLAANQWTIDEIALGMAWRKIK